MERIYSYHGRYGYFGLYIEEHINKRAEMKDAICAWLLLCLGWEDDTNSMDIVTLPL